MDERLVAIEQTVPATQDITLQPSFDGMLAQHLHHASIRSELAAISVLGKVFSEPDFFGHLVDRFETVRLRFVRTKDTEAVRIQSHHFAKEVTQGRNVPRQSGSRLLDIDLRTPEVGHVERLPQQTAVSDGIGAHASRSLRGESLQFWNQPTGLVKQLIGFVAAHPPLEDFQMSWVGRDIGDW